MPNVYDLRSGILEEVMDPVTSFIWVLQRFTMTLEMCFVEWPKKGYDGVCCKVSLLQISEGRGPKAEWFTKSNQNSYLEVGRC